MQGLSFDKAGGKARNRGLHRQRGYFPTGLWFPWRGSFVPIVWREHSAEGGAVEELIRCSPPSEVTCEWSRWHSISAERPRVLRISARHQEFAAV
ncbi:hypothetical protein CEXT_235041 [Caerostris extrusa]|uniref:Uncharacterized protein n=1 Tax=Caerostris extrusa TaxID=172846 RepID=A0AAV4XRW9_CAEEX|nr:hypothetical protein CEXT_235041 [Caerostris extrusa]